MVAENLEDRRQEADRAEALIEEELARFLAALRGRAAGPDHRRAARARRSASRGPRREKTLAGAARADERTRRALPAMAEAIVNKLLHAPQVALKKQTAAGGEAGSTWSRPPTRCSICRRCSRWAGRGARPTTGRRRGARRPRSKKAAPK